MKKFTAFIMAFIITVCLAACTAEEAYVDEADTSALPETEPADTELAADSYVYEEETDSYEEDTSAFATYEEESVDPDTPVSTYIYEDETDTQTSASGYEPMVWIPTDGGIKYHSNPDCSNMENPLEISESEAERLGFTFCKKCYN